MSNHVFSVGEFVLKLIHKLQNDATLQHVLIEGEISQFTAHASSKHWYFSVKDENSQLPCVMWRSDNAKVNFVPKVGDTVQIRGGATVYNKTSNLQFRCESMEQVDKVGKLYLQFEKLKKQLTEEGLFDDSHKKTIPKFNFHIGVVTGKSTAGREDVLNTIQRRWPVATVYECNALMQGEKSAEQVIEALQTLDPMHLDVIILARGGGDYEDLVSFNDETLARVIYAMQTPIITGIGHETDFTIADFVADERAITPTAAAETVTPNVKDIKDSIDSMTKRLKDGVNLTYRNGFQRIQLCSKNRYLQDPNLILQEQEYKLQVLQKRFTNSIESYARNQEHNIAMCKQRIQSATMNSVERNSMQINHFEQQLQRNVTIQETNKEKQLANLANVLDAISPLKVLARGYAVIEKDGIGVSDVKDVNVNDALEIQLQNGKVHTIVTSIEGKDD